MGLVKAYFTASGSWVAPAGITEVLLIGAGGGGAGAPGGTSSTKAGGGGGGGASQTILYATVVPNTTYTITIGDGGVGSSTYGHTPMNGGDTTMGSIYNAIGAEGGYNQDNYWGGGSNNRTLTSYCPWKSAAFLNSIVYNLAFPSYGGTTPRNTTSNLQNTYSVSSTAGFAGGNHGSDSSTCYGGHGGGGGAQGIGADGGNGNSSGAASAGSSAAANSSAGGGGGGCGTSGTAAGGNGGSGFLYILYWD
jgi:hypothetical protein